ncbi:MAG TPA: electron transfer flavoprotein subunit alpha, partial [Thermoplasmata archaeon]|nr:electron transfer flavoprotein subunit alpha [Thermoplasmata archaeon]
MILAADPGDVWVYAERGPDGFEPVSLELLGKSREIADRLGKHLVALTIGDGKEEVGPLQRYDVDETIAVDDPLLSRYDTRAYCAVIETEVRAAKPSILLLGATRNGQDLAGRLAVRLR